jgi:hypothetical protein
MKIIITESQLSKFFTKVSSLPPEDKKQTLFSKLLVLLGSKDQFLGELILKGLQSGHGTVTKIVKYDDDSEYDMEHRIYFSIDSIPFKIDCIYGSPETDNMWYYVLSSDMFGDERLKISQPVLTQIFDFLWKIA